jgi:hypothetical protein
MKLIEVKNDYWVFEEFSINREVYKGHNSALQAREDGNNELAVAILRKNIIDHPWHLNSIQTLIEMYCSFDDQLNGSHTFESYSTINLGVSLGLQAIPSKFSWHSSMLDFDKNKNRPFIMCYIYLAEWYLDNKHKPQAKKIFQRLLAVQPENLMKKKLINRLLRIEKDI